MRRSLLFWVMGVAAFAAVVALLVALPSVAVVDEAGMRPDTATEKFRVQLGPVSFWVASQAQAIADSLNALLLAMLAGMALLTSLFFKGFLPGQPARLYRFFAVVAAGAGVLALDEAFELMQSVAHNIPPVARSDALRAGDVEGLFLVLPLAAFVWFFRDVLLSTRLVAAFWGLGAVLFLAAIVLDFGFSARVEDALEIAATCLFLAGFTAIAFDRLVGELAQELFDPAGGRPGKAVRDAGARRLVGSAR